MIKWEESFSTGDPIIDRQHKSLFEFCNDMQEVIEMELQESYMKNCFKFLEDYLNLHFSFEEECMFKYKCPVAQKNKTAHKTFMEAVQKFKERFHQEKDPVTLLTDLHAFVETWITGHIMGIDVHLKDCIKR